MARNLLRQLGGEPDFATRVAERIAAGDLSVRIDVASDGDTSSLLYAMKSMRDSLTGIVAPGAQRHRPHRRRVAAKSPAGNQNLSNRTEQQAASLEETAASMEELTATVRQNADHAQQANELARVGLVGRASRAAAWSAQVVEHDGRRSTPPRARSSTSSASSTASPSRPTSWR